MKRRTILVGFIVFALSLMFVFSVSFAQKKVSDVITLKMEGGKLAPVNFPHALHADKQKIECAKCHHKEPDPTQPEQCIKCHPITGAKEGVPVFKDAYHKQCIDCHKEVVAKGNKAPTKCTECHKK
ncbi:MAG: cytochrome c family protein [Deltaproteobacteria bacterium]|nr:cytochrome c family protein [Deltaproteobacteria bacterium]